MADSTTNLDTISESQSGKATAANELFDPASPAMLYGRRSSTTSLLTWGYYGGKLLADDGSVVSISNGTVSLTGSATNYVEADSTTGAVSVNQSGFTGGRIPLYQIVCGTTSVSSYTDKRAFSMKRSGSGATIVTNSGTTRTLGESDLNGPIIEFTNSSASTLTIPSNLGAGSFTITQAGTGQVTITPQSGVSLRFAGSAKTRAQWSVISGYRRAADDWVITGDTE